VLSRFLLIPALFVALWLYMGWMFMLGVGNLGLHMNFYDSTFTAFCLSSVVGGATTVGHRTSR
jgi:hypothetical protein